MASFLRAYEVRLLSAPLFLKFATSFVLAAVSNVVAQVPYGKVDWATSLKYGLLDAPPHSHFWYIFLSARVHSALGRTIIDTLIYGPLTSVYFYVASTLLIDRGSWADAKEKMAHGRFLRTMIAGWKFWPLVQFINQRWVPLHFRTLTMDIAGFLWNVYMSIVTGSTAAPVTPRVAPPSPKGGAPHRFAVGMRVRYGVYLGVTVKERTRDADDFPCYSLKVNGRGDVEAVGEQELAPYVASLQPTTALRVAEVKVDDLAKD